MHKMLLPDIDESHHKPHQNIEETIFRTLPTHSKDAGFDGKSIFVNELSRFQEYSIYF